MKCQFAEILVEDKQNTVVRHGAGEHLPVRNARCIGAYPDDVVPVVTQRLHGVVGEVFVRQEAYAVLFLWACQREHLFHL